jgi:arylsulfatase A-like enzyme
MGMGAAVLAMPGPLSAAGRFKRNPNFVIILADDMGYGDSSVYDGWVKMPHLERMAAEGLRFTDFHSSGAVCSPTRAGLMTGRYQQRAGIPGVINADPKLLGGYS